MTLSVTGSDAHGGASEIVVWRRDHVDDLQRLGAIAQESPSWVVPHPSLPLLYATRETDPGGVIVLSVGADGALTLRQQVSSRGALPCHISIDATGSTLVASNYLDGVVAAWSVAPDGAIEDAPVVWRLRGSGPVSARQEASHAHMAVAWARSILVADLGADRLLRLEPGAASQEALAFPPGFGPRHFAILDDRRAVVVGELSAELALVEWAGPSPGVLDIVATSGAGTAQPSGIVARDGDVMVANRGVGTVTSVVVEGDRLVLGAETAVPGENPRAISWVDGRTVVCLQDLGLVATFNGSLTDRPRLTPAPHVSAFAPVPWGLPSVSAPRD